MNVDSKRMSFHQLVLDGIVHEFRVIFHAHFFQDSAAIGADGLHAQGQFLGNFADDLSRGDQSQHLKFAIRKQFLRGLLRVCGQVGGQFFRKGRADVAAARKHFFDGPHQLGWRAFLGHVTRGTTLQHTHGELILRMHAQDEHRKLWTRLFYLPQHFQSAPARHGDVQDHHVPDLFPDATEGFLGIACLAKNGALEFIGENLLQAMSYYCVIVCDKDFHCEAF
ncbi:MAG: Enolase [Pedosphaera sp.]|nr:Enolase [Pedosphaera sp.]